MRARRTVELGGRGHLRVVVLVKICNMNYRGRQMGYESGDRYVAVV